jgi:hypothetical protein
MEYETRTTSRVLDDLVGKLETLPRHHPDRPQLIRAILGLRDEIERPESNFVPGRSRSGPC